MDSVFRPYQEPFHDIGTDLIECAEFKIELDRGRFNLRAKYAAKIISLFPGNKYNKAVFFLARRTVDSLRNAR